MLDSITALDLRGYATLEASFGPGAHLVFGPNAAGKTSLLEAIALLGWGRSHRTNADGELIRWGRDLARVEGRVGGDVLEVAITRSGADGSGGRKRIRINGLGRRASGLGRYLRVVLFAPEEMLLVIGSPSLRRAAIDSLATAHFPAYADDLATYGRTLQQRNSLLRAIREETATRDQLRFWDDTFLDTGGRVVEARLRLLELMAGPLAAAHREIAPEEAAAGGMGLRYVTNAPMLAGETPRDALARRLADTAEKEVWNGSTVIGPHRDDLAFDLAGRDLAGFASRGQQRTAILAFKLAELDLLTELDGRPPLLLAGRRVQRARPRAGAPPRAAHRRAPAGVRDDDHARRPRSGAARGRAGVGGAGDRRRGAADPVDDRRTRRIARSGGDRGRPTRAAG